MKVTGPEFRGAQVNAIKNFNSVVDYVCQVFDTEEVSTLVVDFINSIQYDPSLKLINLEKLAMVGKLITSNLFKQEGTNFKLCDFNISNKF